VRGVVPLASDLGFSFGDPFAIAIAFLGVAILAAIGALSHQQERAFSASILYLGFGLVAALGIHVLDLDSFDPFAHTTLVEHATELAVVVALFATGLKLERELTLRGWRNVALLLLVAMPLTIAAIAVFGKLVMGLSAGAAIALGACLAPTDPVLAGDIGVGPPGDEDEREPNFALTGEAGLNDGLAFPFLLLGVAIAQGDGLLDWALADVLYGIVAGIAVGAVLGWGASALTVWLRDRELLARELDAWVAIGVVALIYGATEILGAYGFLAAFAGGIGFRRHEHTHERNLGVHQGAEVVEDVAELGLILVLGSCVTFAGLGAPGVAGWLLAPLLLLVIRPAAVFVGLAREPLRERLFVGWFGVRGIGSLFYASVVVGLGVFGTTETEVLFWTVVVVVVVSIAVHGVTASPLSRRWLGDP
jgi:NhaP-type Na+/H+ or K+/H+ antiporter